MKKLTRFLIAILIIGTYINDGFAQEKKNMLQGFWKSNNGNIVKIDGNQGILLYTPSELWKKYIDKPIIKNIKQRNDKWEIEEPVRVGDRFLWVDITWELEKNRIIKDLIYLTSEEENYYEKISDDLDYEISVMEKKSFSPSDTDKFDITAGIVKLSGDTTYRIGYPVNWVYFEAEEGYFPFSELEFPLDVYLGSIEFSFEANKWKFSLCVQKEITNDAGDMKDSDWVTPSDPGRLDVYSTSDTNLNVLIWDINFRRQFYKTSNWSFLAGIGYLRENFDFESRLKRQYSPSGLPGYDAVGDGSVGIIYEITYDIPYLEVGTQFNLKEKFSLEASFGYSPIVKVKNKDQHLLINRVNEGDLEGDAFLFSLEGRYGFFKNWFLELQFDYRMIETDKGDMKATFGGTDYIYNHTVAEEVESTQMYTMFKVGYVY